MGSEIKLSEVNIEGSRLDKLRALADILANAIDSVKYAKDLPPLSRQYRECLLEIELLESEEDKTDEIAKLLATREPRSND